VSSPRCHHRHRHRLQAPNIQQSQLRSRVAQSCSPGMNAQCIYFGDDVVSRTGVRSEPSNAARTNAAPQNSHRTTVLQLDFLRIVQKVCSHSIKLYTAHGPPNDAARRTVGAAAHNIFRPRSRPEQDNPRKFSVSAARVSTTVVLQTTCVDCTRLTARYTAGASRVEPTPANLPFPGKVDPRKGDVADPAIKMGLPSRRVSFWFTCNWTLFYVTKRQKDRTAWPAPHTIKQNVGTNEIPRPQFVRPAVILPGSEEERFERHRHLFRGGEADEFDLEGLNWARNWSAFMKQRKDLDVYHEWLKSQDAGL